MATRKTKRKPPSACTAKLWGKVLSKAAAKRKGEYHAVRGKFFTHRRDAMQHARCVAKGKKRVRVVLHIGRHKTVTDSCTSRSCRNVGRY